MILNLNGSDVEIDFFEVGVLQRYQKAVDDLKVARISRENTDEVIKSYCDAVYTFFDTLLGEGAANKIFHGKYNMKICINCLTICLRECMSYFENDFDKEIKVIASSWNDLLK